jgi:hypothetical protein
MIELGDRVRDRITGYQGIVIGITDWLYGCRRPFVQPESLDKDGSIVKSESFDEDQLEIVAKGIVKRTVNASLPSMQEATTPVQPRTGGPAPAPTQHTSPSR